MGVAFCCKGDGAEGALVARENLGAHSRGDAELGDRPVGDLKEVLELAEKQVRQIETSKTVLQLGLWRGRAYPRTASARADPSAAFPQRPPGGQLRAVSERENERLSAGGWFDEAWQSPLCSACGNWPGG